MENPDGLGAVTAVEVDFEGGAVLGLEMVVVAVAAASPVFLWCCLRETPIMPGTLNGNDAVFFSAPGERYRLGWDSVAANGYFFADESRHGTRNEEGRSPG